MYEAIAWRDMSRGNGSRGASAGVLLCAGKSHTKEEGKNEPGEGEGAFQRFTCFGAWRLGPIGYHGLSNLDAILPRGVSWALCPGFRSPCLASFPNKGGCAITDRP